MEKHVEQTFSLNKEKLKFIRLICNKCRNVISKNFTIKEKFKIENKDETNGLFVSKLIYLKSIFLSNKTKLKNKGENVFLYQHVKCVQCARKIGKFIKSAAGKKFDYIDSVIFTHYDIVM